MLVDKNCTRKGSGVSQPLDDMMTWAFLQALYCLRQEAGPWLQPAELADENAKPKLPAVDIPEKHGTHMGLIWTDAAHCNVQLTQQETN